MLGRSFSHRQLGGVFSTLHNTNPLSIFDLDTFLSEDETDIRTKSVDIIGTLHLIETLGSKLKLDWKEISAASILFQELLLSKQGRFEPFITRVAERIEEENLKEYFYERLRQYQSSKPSREKVYPNHSAFSI